MQVKVTISRAHKIVERLKRIAATEFEHARSGLAPVQVGGFAGEAQASELYERFEKGKAAMQRHAWVLNQIAQARTAIASANERHGISKLLAEQSALQQTLQTATTIAALNAREGLIAIDALESYRPFESSQQSLRAPGVSVQVASKLFLKDNEAHIIEMSARLSRIADEISDANASRIDIDLADELAHEVGLMS